MKTSTHIQPLANLVGKEKSIELIAKAGFDAWDFSLFDMCRYNWAEHKANVIANELNGDNYVNYAKKLRKIGEDNGIVCNQSHAPFPSHDTTIESYLKRAIECTAIAGGEICVIHPINYLSAIENANFYRKFLDFAKQHNVKIATENMFGHDRNLDVILPHACATPKDFYDHIQAVNDDYFVACVDIGHAEIKPIRTSACEIIYTLKDKVQALHIHDNDLYHDNHATPFTKNIKFEPIVKALKDINYSGYLTLECDAHYKNGGYTAETALEGTIALYDSVKRINDMF